MEEIQSKPQVYRIDKKNDPQVYTTQGGIKEIKDSPYVYTTHEDIEEIQNNFQGHTTREGMEEIKNSPYVIHYKRGYGGDEKKRV